MKTIDWPKTGKAVGTIKFDADTLASASILTGLVVHFEVARDPNSLQTIVPSNPAGPFTANLSDYASRLRKVKDEDWHLLFVTTAVANREELDMKIVFTFENGTEQVFPVKAKNAKLFTTHAFKIELA